MHPAYFFCKIEKSTFVRKILDTAVNYAVDKFFLAQFWLRGIGSLILRDISKNL